MAFDKILLFINAMMMMMMDDLATAFIGMMADLETASYHDDIVTIT